MMTQINLLVKPQATSGGRLMWRAMTLMMEGVAETLPYFSAWFVANAKDQNKTTDHVIFEDLDDWGQRGWPGSS